MKPILVSLAALTLSVATSLPASASVLYSQSAALTSSWLSETANGSDNSFNQAFDDFSVGTTQTISNVAWTGFLLPDYMTIDAFTISFYADNFDTSGSPGAVGDLLASTTISGDANEAANAIPNVNAFGVFNFNADIDPFVADAGTTYWISIVADPDKNSGDFRWAWSDQGDGTFNTFDGNSVSAVGTDLAFSLSSPVPEPSSLLLMGSGMLALVGAGRRRLVR